MVDKKSSLQLQRVFIIVFFGLIYISISLVNHYNFYTSGFDLGIYNHALNDYANFSWNNPTLLTLANRNIENILGDHFSLYVLLISPLRWIFGTYTLLIFQISAVLFGGYGIYKLIHHFNKSHKIAMMAMIHFFLIWGIYSALSFDYHNNVVAAMFVPWFIMAIFKEQWHRAIFFYILIIIGKENMALWLIFINTGLLVHFFGHRKKMWVTGVMAVFAAIYFVIVVKLIIPAIAGGAEYHHWNYTSLGENFQAAVVKMFKNPQYVFTLLFEDPDLQKVAFGIKSELHFVVLCSGGVALLARPQFLIMLLPIFAQKLFHESYVKWGLNYHYSIEFAPILTIALFYWISSIHNLHKKVRLAIIAVIITGTTTAVKLDHRVSKWYSARKSKFFISKHWEPPFNVSKIHSMLREVPDGAPVSAQSVLVPHLAFRDTIYQYPVVKKAEIIALIPGATTTYPLKQKEYDEKLQKLKENKTWEIWKESKDAVFFRRKTSD